MSTLANTNAFDYINVLDKAADASWLRESTLANNIANATTPDFKRYDVDFQSLLERELMDSKYNRNLDSRVHNMNLDRLTATSRIDMAAESFHTAWMATMWICTPKMWSWLRSRFAILRLQTAFHRSLRACVQR